MASIAFNFTADSILGTAPFTVNFSSFVTKGSVESWLWYFGDGDTSTESNPSHIYTNSGSYTVILKGTSNLGEVVTISKTSLINVAKLDFSIFPSVGQNPLVANFSDNSTIPSGFQISQYTWNFGDGTSSYTTTSSSAIHVYRQVGTFPVIMSVKIRKV